MNPPTMMVIVFWWIGSDPVEFLKKKQTSIVETRRLRHLLNSENGLNTKRHALRSLNGSTRKN